MSTRSRSGAVVAALLVIASVAGTTMATEAVSATRRGCRGDGKVSSTGSSSTGLFGSAHWRDAKGCKVVLDVVSFAMNDTAKATASWLSPYTGGGRNHLFEVDLSANTLLLGGIVEIAEATRVRYRGGRWGPWHERVVSVPAGPFADYFAISPPPAKPSAEVRFQWRARIEVVAPAISQFDVTLRLDGLTD